MTQLPLTPDVPLHTGHYAALVHQQSIALDAELDAARKRLQHVDEMYTLAMFHLGNGDSYKAFIIIRAARIFLDAPLPMPGVSQLGDLCVSHTPGE